MRAAILWACLAAVAAVRVDASGDCANFTQGVVPLGTARGCFETVPYNATLASLTIDFLVSSLQQYSYVDLFKDSGSPYFYSFNMLEELEALRSTSFSSDLAFQDAVTRILLKPQDAHTYYSKPRCYSALVGTPLAFVTYVDSAFPSALSVVYSPGGWACRGAGAPG